MKYSRNMKGLSGGRQHAHKQTHKQMHTYAHTQRERLFSDTIGPKWKYTYSIATVHKSMTKNVLVVFVSCRLAHENNLWGRKGGLMGIWGPIIYEWLDECLPSDAAKRCQGRCAHVWVFMCCCLLVKCSSMLVYVYTCR